MGEREAPTRNPYAEDDEDTAETSLAGRFFLWRWYKRTTRGFGQSRTFFMPIGFLALASLALYLGFPALEALTERLLLALHRAIAMAVAWLGGESDSDASAILSLPVRRSLAPLFTLAWAGVISAAVVIGAIPPKPERDELGYVVSSSEFGARLWAVVGKRLWQLKQAGKFLLFYLRDLNLQKVHLPISLLMLLGLGFGSLTMALENALWEIPLRVDALGQSTGWIVPTARIAALVVTLMLGVPMLANSLLRAHVRSVDMRTERQVGFIRRRLSGLLGIPFVFAPLAWMFIHLLAGRLT